jgi:uncharacterized lipoprotein YmbA
MREISMPCAGTLLLLISLALGCGLHGDGARFYTLSAARSAAPLARHPLRVGLGPVLVPAFLDAPTIATRIGPNRIEYARFDRWAVPLASEVRRALGEGLGEAGTVSVVPYPWYSSTALDAVVRVDLLAFESDVGGTAHLDATWSVADPKTGTVRSSERTTLTEPAGARTTEAAVAALSRTLMELARRIADVLPAAKSGE